MWGFLRDLPVYVSGASGCCPAALWDHRNSGTPGDWNTDAHPGPFHPMPVYQPHPACVCHAQKHRGHLWGMGWCPLVGPWD